MPSKLPAQSNAPNIQVLQGLGEISSQYGIILCDIWGVLHDGQKHFPAAAAALTQFRASGGRVVLITNAPRPHGPIRAQLDDLGVPRSAYDNMVTSGDATIALIDARGTQSIHHIGPPRDLTLFDESALVSGHQPRLKSLDQADYVVCTGLFDDDSETPDDYKQALSLMLARGMTMICANPDIIVHRGDTLLYCSGALAQSYAAMGGQVLQAGKPYAPIYEMALQMAGLQDARVLAIGDAMATDILGATNQGIDALFVTQGIHRDTLHAGGQESHDEHAFQTMITAAHHPRYAINKLRW